MASGWHVVDGQGVAVDESLARTREAAKMAFLGVAPEDADFLADYWHEWKLRGYRCIRVPNPHLPKTTERGE